MTRAAASVACQAVGDSYREGGRWKPVETSELFAVKKDQFNKVSFSAVNTDALRLDVKLKPGFSGGILRIRVR